MSFFNGTNKQNKPGISSILIYPPPKKTPEDHFLYDISQCSMRENFECYKPIWVLEILLGVRHTPLKNMRSSVGSILPNIWKSKIHVPNHQPEYLEMSSLSASHKRTQSKFRDSHYPLWVVPMFHV